MISWPIRSQIHKGRFVTWAILWRIFWLFLACALSRRDHGNFLRSTKQCCSGRLGSKRQSLFLSSIEAAPSLQRHPFRTWCRSKYGNAASKCRIRCLRSVPTSSRYMVTKRDRLRDFDDTCSQIFLPSCVRLKQEEVSPRKTNAIHRGHSKTLCNHRLVRFAHISFEMHLPRISGRRC